MKKVLESKLWILLYEDTPTPRDMLRHRSTERSKEAIKVGAKKRARRRRQGYCDPENERPGT